MTPADDPTPAAHAGAVAARPVRVALADDQALVRAGFRALLAHTPGIEIIGEAADGREALALARAHRPDVLLMDIRMPVLDGIEATRLICADPALAAVRVVVLTTYALDEYVFAALRAGASGFLLKDTDPDQLRAAIRVIAAGDALLSPAVTRTLIAAFTAAPQPRPADLARLATLTDREREIAALAAHGLDNAEIGARLHISPATAKTHITRAMTKLAARDRAQLVVLAYQTGLVTAPRP